MFGYIKTDDPYLYKKDEVLYKSMYCGLCKSIGNLCGQMARFGLTYDVAFLSVLLHNIADKDVVIEKKRCVAHWFKKQNIAKNDEIFDKMSALNTLMCYYKALDDYADTGKKGVKRALFKKGYKLVKRRYPELVEYAENCYKKLGDYEKEKCASPDMVADPFSNLSETVSVYVLGEKSTEHTQKLFYYLGKWIYLIDALDDYDKDVKNGEYNVFYYAYGAKDGKELISKHKEDIFPYLNSVFWNLKEALTNVKFYFNKDLIENVLLRGIPVQTDKIVKKYLS